MTPFKFHCFALLLTCGVGSPLLQGAVPALYPEWKSSVSPLSVTADLPGEGDATVSFEVRNGQDGKLLSPKPRQSEDTDTYANGLSIRHTITPVDGAVLWKCVFTNTNREGDLWFEPSLRLPLADGAGVYWDGYEKRPLSAAPLKRNILTNTYPVACVLAEPVNFALGFAPSPKSSYWENGVDADRRAYTATRIALPAQQSSEITFVLFPFEGDYEEFDAMNRYQNLFPEAFSYVPGVDERLVNGQFNSSHYEGILTGSINSPMKVKYCGQGRVGLSWSYTYYRKQGDFYGHEACWEDITPVTPQRLAGRKYKTENELNVDDRLLMHQDRNARFKANDFRGNTLNGIYIFNTIDKDVIEKNGFERYVFPLMKGQSPYQGWALGYDLSGHVFGWASPLEQIYKRDIPPLLAENDMQAISYDGFIDLDTPTPIDQCEVYRGELDYFIPGWSYDAKGRYIRMSRYIQEHCDYFHSLKKDDMTLGVWSNVWFVNPLIAFKPDAYLYENFDPTRLYGEMYDMFHRGLYFRGNRPAYMHNIDYETQLSRYLAWQKMSPLELRLAAEDYVRDEIALFYQANLMPVWKLILSHRDIYQEIPFLTELSERGHYPPCPVRGDGALEKVRYGQGLNTLLVLTNRDRKSGQITQRIDNDYIGNFTTVPFLYRGGKTLEARLQGAQTEFSCAIGPRENLLITTPVALKTATENTIAAQSVMTNNPYEKLLKCTLTANTDGEAELFFNLDTGFELYRASWNGQEIQSGDNIELFAGQPGEFELIQRSKLWQEPVEDLLRFNFRSAVVLLPEAADERLRGCAQMIEDNLRCGLDHHEVKTVTAAPENGNAIVLAYGDNGVYRQGSNLVVSGPDSFRIQQNAWHLMRLMDRYYPGVNMSWMKIMESDEFRDKMLDGHQIPFAIQHPDQTVNWMDYLKSNDEMNATVPFGYTTEVTIPANATAPLVDGDLSDAVWEQAALVEDFRIVGSQESPKCRTQVRMLADRDNLYFAVKCLEPQMDKLADTFTTEDSPLWEGDDFEIRLAPGIPASEKTPYPFYMFAFSPSGVMTELLHMPYPVTESNAQKVLGDDWAELPVGAEWNGDWTAKLRREEKSWNAEVAIPWSTLRTQAGQPLRIMLGRGEKPLPEDSSWPLILEGNFNSGAFFGNVEWSEE